MPESKFRKAIKKRMLKFYENECIYCGRDDVPLTIDHLVPKSLGGVSYMLNTVPSCQQCNRKKNDKHPSELNLPESVLEKIRTAQAAMKPDWEERNYQRAIRGYSPLGGVFWWA